MSYYDNSLSTAHTKMGGPTFVNEKVVHILEKVLNFEQTKYPIWELTKAALFPLKMDKRSWLNFCQWKSGSKVRLSDYHYKHLNWFLQISNLRSLTKAPLFPLEDGQTVLAQPTQRWAALLLSMKKWFTNSKKNNVVLNFERKVRKTISL